MMSVKENLFLTIQELTDEQAEALLQMAQRLQKEKPNRTLLRLASNPAIKLPEGGFKPFPPVEPIKVEGIPPSQLLMEDRR